MIRGCGVTIDSTEDVGIRGRKSGVNKEKKVSRGAANRGPQQGYSTREDRGRRRVGSD